MYVPQRGGTRGGAALFSWEDVKNDKDREFYLGNSVAAPTGRWQAGRDINWYTKEKSDEDAEKRREELRAIKQMEEAMMYEKLGIAPPGEAAVGSNLLRGADAAGPSKGSGANTAPLDVTKKRWGPADDAVPVEGEAEGITEEDRRLARKLAKREVRHKIKEEKRAEREERRSKRGDGDRHRSRDHDERRHRHHERDRSRDRHRHREDPDRTRSRSPSRSHRRDERSRRDEKDSRRRDDYDREESHGRRRADSRERDRPSRRDDRDRDRRDQ